MIRQILLDLNYNRYMIELGVYIIGCLLALGLLIGIYFFFKADPDLHNDKQSFNYIRDRTCCICLFDKDDEIILSCGHSFCKECLFRLYYEDEEEPVSCPLCRKIATFMIKGDDSNDQDLDSYNQTFKEWKKLKRKLRNYGVKGLKLIALSPFLSILALRIFQVLLGISYIIYFIMSPCICYILKPGALIIADYLDYWTSRTDILI